MFRPSLPQTFLYIALLAGLAGCGKEPSAASSAAPPPIEVEVLEVKTEPVTLSQELPGRTSAYRVAEVRARVSGIVEKRLFEEGANVEAGDVLFEIDPAPFQAALDSARANLARAEAGLSAAAAQTERFEGLVSTNAISRQSYDDAFSAQLSLKAEVASAEAAVRAAEINLGYTRVTAPITGRIGRAEVTEGAYVQQATATMLARIQQLDPLYVDLSRSAEEVLRLKASLESGRLARAGEGAAEIRVILEGDRFYEKVGELRFSDVSVDPGTGTVMLRGTVPNPDLDLMPGMFVRARIEEGTDPNAILVPQSIVSRNARGEGTVLVAGTDGKAELRVIEARRAVGNRWLVAAGLEPGDRIIVDNRHKVRPGSAVTVASSGVAEAR